MNDVLIVIIGFVCVIGISIISYSNGFSAGVKSEHERIVPHTLKIEESLKKMAEILGVSKEVYGDV